MPDLNLVNMEFKFFRGDYYNLNLEPGFLIRTEQNMNFGTLTLRNHVNVDNEYCMQFDDEEPLAFATGGNDLNIRVSPTSGGDIRFTHNGRRFRLFARERQQ